MSTIEQIRDLNIENVEPEHFIELGSEVVQALRDILGDDAVREIYDVAKGEDKEGFGERFADALERYTEIHGELFHPPDVEPPAAEAVSTADIGDSTYEKGLPSFDVTNNLLVYGRCSELYRQIDRAFETMFPNQWLRSQHENYRYEARNLAAFCVTKNCNVTTLEEVGLYLREYYGYLKDNGYRAGKSYRLLCEFFNQIPLQQQAA